MLAGTVADAAVTLGVMAGTGFDLAGPSRLRIAVSVRPPGPGIVVHRTCAAAVRQCARQLAALDHDVQRGDPRYPGWLVPVMLSYLEPGGFSRGVGAGRRTWPARGRAARGRSRR